MKLTVLVDNNTIIDRYFYGEPGVSYFIECDVNTVGYFEKCQPRVIHACHCTDLPSKIGLAQVTHVADVGVGLVLEYK